MPDFEVTQRVALEGVLLSVNDLGTPGEWGHVGVDGESYGYDILLSDLKVVPEPQWEYGIRWLIKADDGDHFWVQEKLPEALCREYATQEGGQLVRRILPTWEDVK